MEKKHRLELVGITYNQIESGVYALILQQAGGTRRIPIIIGFPEAQAIECKLQEVATPRPLTHDTMVTTLAAFGISLIEVNIRKLPNGVFAADLVFSNGQTEKIVDSRSSDAVALAIRVGAPIFTSDSVMREAGFDPDNGPSENDEAATPGEERHAPEADKSDLTRMSDAQLSAAMMKAAENENYEEAGRIKAELDRRKSKSDHA